MKKLITKNVYSNATLHERDFDRLCEYLDFDKPIVGNISIGNIRNYLRVVIDKTNNDYDLIKKIIEIKFEIEYPSEENREKSSILFALASREIGRKDLFIHFIKMSKEWKEKNPNLVKFMRNELLTQVLK